MQSMEPEVPEHQRPDGLAEFAEQQSALLAALGALPREQRETFLLHEETGLTIEEIARVTDVGLETAKSRLRYAIRKLKKSLLPVQIPEARPLRPPLRRARQTGCPAGTSPLWPRIDTIRQQLVTAPKGHRCGGSHIERTLDVAAPSARSRCASRS